MKFLLAIILSITLFSCAHSSKKPELNNGNGESKELLENSQESYLNAYKARSRHDKKQYSKEGIFYANECLKIAPNKAGCYYFRAANTGLYYQAKIVGYQKGLKQMVKDCEKLIALDPSYENAGAYLILGQIYSQVPITAARVGDITRDLELAEKYLLKSVEIAPNYPENHIYLANVQLELGKINEAKSELNKATKNFKDWNSSPYIEEWKKLANDIKKELKKLN